MLVLENQHKIVVPLFGAAYMLHQIRPKQEMSQTRDECPQRNWSSTRHI